MPPSGLLHSVAERVHIVLLDIAKCMVLFTALKG